VRGRGSGRAAKRSFFEHCSVFFFSISKSPQNPAAECAERAKVKAGCLSACPSVRERWRVRCEREWTTRVSVSAASRVSIISISVRLFLFLFGLADGRASQLTLRQKCEKVAKQTKLSRTELKPWKESQEESLNFPSLLRFSYR